MSTLEKDRQKVIVPTPVLSEVLVRAGTAGPAYLEVLNRSARFHIADFDQRAAVEVATASRQAIDAGDKRGGSESPWTKIKFDRQIIAIAKVAGATTIYSDDSDLARFSKSVGIAAIRIQDLPLPPEDAQFTLPLDETDGAPNP